jgi:hypothetical protein
MSTHPLVKIIETTHSAWIVPPRCQGQIVEIAYAQYAYGICRRITDRSLSAAEQVQYQVAIWPDCGHEVEECNCDVEIFDRYDPINSEPSGFEWRTV